MFILPFLNHAKTLFVQMAPGMPPETWWVTASVLIILALTATIDSFTEEIPEAMIFLGLCAIIAVQGLIVSWEVAAQHLRLAIAMGLLIWAINFAWYWKYRYDALGMGDAKWTMLAVACFGIDLGLYAWGIGSVLATIYIGLFRLFKVRIAKVTFSPFLFVALSVALYRVRFW
jgi:prepilin signal peptidase PulO-like enzyme (type II secretory pathway)